MESPMASGPEPLNPDLSESHVAKTVNTSTNEVIASKPNVCPSDTPSLGFGVHTRSVVFVRVERPSRIPAPQIAPTDWTTMYRKVLYSQRTHKLISSDTLRFVPSLYTVSHNKTCHFVFDNNSGVSWSIFILFVPVETGRNTLQFTYLMA